MSTDQNPMGTGRDPWLVPPEQRPMCPMSGKPCTSWTCLVDVCASPTEAVLHEVRANVERDIVRAILEAVCTRDGISLLTIVGEPGEPARNYELALRLGIGQVFGLTSAPEEQP